MNKKNILKTITWRITASTTTLLLVYILTGEIKIAGSVTLLEIIVKSIIYYLHETIWDEATVKKKEEIEKM